MAWTIDPTHSLVEFTVKHMMITKVRGRFGEFTGELHIDEANPAASSAEGTVQLASIDTGEAQRDGHLRSADFFDVEQHPTMHFRSTRIEPTGEDTFDVYGDLTIKGHTHEVRFDVTHEGGGTDPWGNQRLGFSATATINRKAFGLTWNQALETGGVLVGDEVKIAIEIQAVKEQPAPATADAAS